jgi:hypothetical protein
VNQTVIAPAGRGDNRPIWELVYNHYVNRRGLAAPNTADYAARVRPEGGGGDYGPNSGGYDQLGYGTLTFTLDPSTRFRDFGRDLLKVVDDHAVGIGDRQRDCQ